MASITLDAGAAPNISLPSPGDQHVHPPATSVPAWTPTPSTLNAVVALVSHTTAPDTHVQTRLYEQLQTLSKAPDFCCYLAHILVSFSPPTLTPTAIEAIRQPAGLLLKAQLRPLFAHLHPVVRHYIATTLVSAVAHPSLPVRLTVASCLSEAVRAANSLSAVDPLLSLLLHALHDRPSRDPLALDPPLTVLARLTEDVPNLLKDHPTHPLDRLIPACMRLCASHPGPVRATTLTVFNHLIVSMPPAMRANIDPLLATLLSVADDVSPQVRKRIATALCLVLDALPHALTPHMPSVIEFMLAASRHPDPFVAREASEFWPLFAHAAATPNVLRPFLPRLVPVLLDNMTYTQDDINALDSEAAAEAAAASMGFQPPEEMRPRFHQPKFRDAMSLAATSNAQHAFAQHNALNVGGDSANGVDSDMNGLGRGGGGVPVVGVNGHATASAMVDVNGSSSSIQADVILDRNIGNDSEALDVDVDVVGNFGDNNESRFEKGKDDGQGDVHTGNHNNRDMQRDREFIRDVDNDRHGGNGKFEDVVVDTTDSRRDRGDRRVNIDFDGRDIRNGMSNHNPNKKYEYSDKGEDVNDDSSDDDDDNDDTLFEEGSEWSVRKCSASALDALSAVFKEELLELVLPQVQDKLNNGERWEARECALLALGAMAEGCGSAMTVHMASLLRYLLVYVSDEHHMVRSIACWTLSRYCKWVVSQRDDTHFQQLLKVLLERMLDRNKVVQKASCSALAVFEEESGSLLSSYLTPILTSVSAAFGRYPRSNLYVLYDVVCTLADAVGSELANPDHVNMLMPLLTTRWNAVADDDMHMLPLLECLASVFRALGSRSEHFAANIFLRCSLIIDAIFTKESNIKPDPVHVEFLTCCLDLMCALTEALGSSVSPFVANVSGAAAAAAAAAASTPSTSHPSPQSKPRAVLELLLLCMRDGRQEVRQSAFAFLGELARARIPALVPVLLECFTAAVNALNPLYMSVSNNATWALGELVMMAGFLPASVLMNANEIQRTILDDAVDALVCAVNTAQLNKSLLENSALTLGRIGLILPRELAPKLASFAEAVFSALRNIRDDLEKEQAFHGMNAMITVNPMAICSVFVYYVDAIASWYQCKPQLEIEFGRILKGYKTALGEKWIDLFNSLPPHSQSLLNERFNV